MARKKPDAKGNNPPEKLMRELAQRMEACPDAETLNDQVIIPFAAALETICAARGYMLNIYGETSNIVFTGDTNDTEMVYRIVEEYLDREE